MFTEKKQTLAMFFDVNKAYDNVWHARLLYMLKNVGISGMIFQYVKHFLRERCICTRVGNTYSSRSAQLLLLSYLLFLYMIFQKRYKKNTYVAQYAHAFAIWVNTTARKHMNKRVVKLCTKARSIRFE